MMTWPLLYFVFLQLHFMPPLFSLPLNHDAPATQISLLSIPSTHEELKVLFPLQRFSIFSLCSHRSLQDLLSQCSDFSLKVTFSDRSF